MSVAPHLQFVSRQQHGENTRHVFRALLRECTYLPDAASRKYIPRYIRRRFDNASERAAQILRRVDKNGSIQDEEKRQLDTWLQNAHKGRSQLIRANEGELKPLMRILRHTYGRNGPRRYELMRALLVPDVDYSPSPSESAAADVPRSITTAAIPRIFAAPSEVTGSNVIYTISPAYSRLSAIVASQAQKNIDSHRTRLLKRISIPATNSWGRSMPRKRVQNLVQKQYAKLLDAILPPLPAHEWTQLRDLAVGAVEWDGCKPRRKRPAGCPTNLKANDLEKLVHTSDEVGERLHLDDPTLSRGTSKTEKIMSLGRDGRARSYWTSHDTWLDDESAMDDAFDAVLEDELRVKTINKNLTGSNRGHRITPRFMRRLWMAIHQQCPMLKPTEDGRVQGRWKVHWGTKPRVNEIKEDSTGLEELYGIDFKKQSTVNAPAH